MKSIENPEFNNDFLIYKCSIKLLHFSDVSDNPIVLFIYDVRKNNGYALFLQKYIYLQLDNENINWRKNKNTVTLKIPTGNFITKEKVDYNFEEIAYNGFNIIAPLALRYKSSNIS